MISDDHPDHCPPGRNAATATSWHSAHIHYHQPDKDPLLLDAIRPLCHQLRPVVERAYVVRHWRQGPHLRLHVRTDPHTWATVVRPQLEHTIGSHLRAHSSTAGSLVLFGALDMIGFHRRTID